MTALVGAGSKPARCDNDYILLILGGFRTRPYEVCYLGSIFSNNYSYTSLKKYVARNSQFS